MKLDKRLMSVCSVIPRTEVLADVGSDHAYLPAYMITEGFAKRAIVSDVNMGPLDNGKNTCRMAGIYDKCEFRLGSGMSVLNPGEADVITVCGMGGELMLSFLEASPEVARSAEYIVLQPQSGFEELYTYLCENGYGILDEKIVHDRHLYYRIILCSYGAPVKKDDSMYPALLALRRDETYRDFLMFRLGLCESIISKINDSGKENEETVSEMQTEIERINKVLKLYESQGDN